MKTLNAKVVSTMVAAILAVAAPAAWAQSPADGHHVSAAPKAAGGMDGGMPMMDMCRQMMPVNAMQGMGADQTMDPKMQAHMLQMRGEMMKVMGEVMMKHGAMMMTPKDR
jgi:hypothetical protein